MKLLEFVVLFNITSARSEVVIDAIDGLDITCLGITCGDPTFDSVLGPIQNTTSSKQDLVVRIGVSG